MLPRRLGTAIVRWLRCCATSRKVAGSISAGVSGFFIDIKSFGSHYGPGVESPSNKNEYQEYFLGGKGGRCVRLTTYHHSVPLSRNLGTLTSWNPLGPSGPVTKQLNLYLYPDVCLQKRRKTEQNSEQKMFRVEIRLQDSGIHNKARTCGRCGLFNQSHLSH